MNTIELSANDHASLNDRARIGGYDFGFAGRDAVPASVRSQDISGKSADHLIGLLTP